MNFESMLVIASSARKYCYYAREARESFASELNFTSLRQQNQNATIYFYLNIYPKGILITTKADIAAGNLKFSIVNHFLNKFNSYISHKSGGNRIHR